MGGQANVDLAGEKGSCREDDRRCEKTQARLRHHPGHAPAFDEQVVDRLLEQAQVWLCLHHGPDGRLVQHAIGLAAGGAHGGTL